MNRNQPMRQYANQSQSGTISSSGLRKEPIDNLTDRVMMIAQRVVGAENQIKNQASEIKLLNDTITKLEKKIENMALKASGKEFKKPTTRPSRKKIVEEEVESTSILDEGVEVW